MLRVYCYYCLWQPRAESAAGSSLVASAGVKTVLRSWAANIRVMGADDRALWPVPAPHWGRPGRESSENTNLIYLLDKLASSLIMAAANDSFPPLPRAACQSTSLGCCQFYLMMSTHIFLVCNEMEECFMHSSSSVFPDIVWAELGNKCVRVTAPCPIEVLCVLSLSLLCFVFKSLSLNVFYMTSQLLWADFIRGWFKPRATLYFHPAFLH